MPQGTLEVVLVSAKGLENTDFLFSHTLAMFVLGNMDPYVILTCRTQEHKSTVASGKGSNPDWNETFIFSISSGVHELKVKIMDSDNGSNDDFVGEATYVWIPLEALFAEGSIPTTVYNVVKDQEYCGEIKLALTFNPKEDCDGGDEEESFGGWKQSSYE